MDFALTTDGVTPDMTFTKATDITNNIYLSLAIIRGSWWFNPAFGMRDTRRLKNTPASARLIESWIKEALQWLLDNGRASAVEVTLQQDRLQNPNRLLALIEVTQANGTVVTFEKFVEVV